MGDGRMGGGEEERLLEQIAAGDVDAFAALYDRYSRSVYSLACRMLGDSQTAQEITQDVFEGIWRGARAFTPRRGNARGWILALAHHKSVDALRRQKVRAVEPLSEVQAHDADVVAVALARVEGEAVRAALGTLSDVQRTVVVLAYYGGYTQQEIAHRLAVPLGTIKTRMRDGLQRLRTALGGVGESMR
ncbi:MAG TPA: sigma-70 family RNA polymerase sigma factor [bacterium]|nr:sigma-70 family RNA polymerase sigma factor [bacterium]